MRKPLAIDLYAGLGGWSEALLAEGYDVVGFDIERHQYGDLRYPAQLVIQDVLTLHGSQFRDATLIVASPPCQFFSYCAMPWARAKQLAAEVRADPVRLEKELSLFKACFRIQREVCEAAGRHVPLIVENVRGAQPWVGRARWSFGSFFLFGDVPALMPIAMRAPKFILDDIKNGQRREVDWVYADGRKVQGNARDATVDGTKQGGDWLNQSQPSISRRCNSKSSARKAASALIAKIPQPLAQHIARTFLPRRLPE